MTALVLKQLIPVNQPLKTLCKEIFLIFTVLFLTLALTGCASNEDENPGVPPEFTSASSATVFYGQTDTNYTAVATDQNNDSITYSITEGADADLFSVDSVTGVLSFIEAPEFMGETDDDGDGVYEVTLAAADGVDGMATLELNLTITRGARTIIYLSQGQKTLYRIPDDDNTTTPVAVSGVASTSIVSFELSPDSTHLAYIADGDTEGVYELYVTDLVNSEVVKVSSLQTTDGDVTDFRWSPQSDRLMYRADGGTGIPDTDSSDETDADSGMDTDAGSESTFVDEDFRLYIVDADGTNFELISLETDFSNTSYTLTQQFEWASDGNAVAYLIGDSSDTLDYGLQLYLHSVSSAGQTSQLVFSVLSGKEIQELSWSPDGAYIAFLTDRFKEDNQYEIWGFHTEEGDAVRLNGNVDTALDSTTVYVGEVVWSPGGNYLAHQLFAYSTEAAATVSAMAIDVVNVSNPAGIVSTRVSDIGSNASYRVTKLLWDDSGQRLGYIDDHLTEGVSELFVYDIAMHTNLSDEVSDFTTRINEDLVADQDVESFNWSPDSSYLVFSVNATDETDASDDSDGGDGEDSDTGNSDITGTGLYLRDREASVAARELRSSQSEGTVGTELVWSGNSDYVAFLTTTNDLSTWMISDTEGSIITASEPVASSAASQTPEWSADNIVLAYANSTGVYSYSLLESVEKLLTASLPHSGLDIEYSSLLSGTD